MPQFGNSFVSRLAQILVAVLLVNPGGDAAFAQPDPFQTLRGKWAGSGTMVLADGSKERLSCRATYSGTSSQLALLIDCTSKINKIRMTAKLSANSNDLLGAWEEETYKVRGAVSGRATTNRIKFYIAGNVLGTMDVKYSAKRQEVSIDTASLALRNVKISMSRR